MKRRGKGLKLHYIRMGNLRERGVFGRERKKTIGEMKWVYKSFRGGKRKIWKKFKEKD